MTVTQHTTAANKQAVCKKLVTLLGKRYKKSLPTKNSRPVLETIIFAICQENLSPEKAEELYARLESWFHDLNEVRVSSISELTEVFHDVSQPELRALKIRTTLQYVFETHYMFDFEILRRKTFDLAKKQLLKIKSLSPFVRSFTLQTVLGSHVVPLDDQMCGAAIWLGLVDPASKPERASDSLKSAVRKSDAPLFCHLLCCLANDSKLKRTFDPQKLRTPQGGFDLSTAPSRLDELFKRPTARRKPASKKKSSSAKKKKTSATKKTKKSKGKRAAGSRATSRTSRAKTTAKKTKRKTTAAKSTTKKTTRKKK